MSVEGYDPQTGHMDFSLALREMKKGKKVRRACWDKPHYIRLVGGCFWISYGDGSNLTHEELLATDWEEVL